jgi:hypothetical protein
MIVADVLERDLVEFEEAPGRNGSGVLTPDLEADAVDPEHLYRRRVRDGSVERDRRPEHAAYADNARGSEVT